MKANCMTDTPALTLTQRELDERIGRLVAEICVTTALEVHAGPEPPWLPLRISARELVRRLSPFLSHN